MNLRSRVVGFLSTFATLVVLSVAGTSAAVLFNPWAFDAIVKAATASSTTAGTIGSTVH
jgi:hypothetical protein